MPDHLHLIVEGTTLGASLRSFAKLAKQFSAYYVKREHRLVLWKPGFHDRVIREDENLRAYVRYVCENPVVAGLVRKPEEYPFLFLATSWRDL